MPIFSFRSRVFNTFLLICVLFVSCNSGNKVVSSFGKRKYTKGYYSLMPSKPKNARLVKDFRANPVNKTTHSESFKKLENNRSEAMSTQTKVIPDKPIINKKRFVESFAKTMNTMMERGMPMLLMNGLSNQIKAFPDTSSISDSKKSKTDKTKRIIAEIFMPVGVGAVILGVELNSIPVTGILLLVGALLVLVGVALIAQKRTTNSIYHPNSDHGRGFSNNANANNEGKSHKDKGGCVLIVLGLIGAIILGFIILIGLALGPFVFAAFAPYLAAFAFFLFIFIIICYYY